MPWDGRRKAGLPPDWSKIRLRVLKRDDYRCRWPLPYNDEECGQEAHEVDHRVDRHDHRDDSLWSLCQYHHQRKTQREAAEGRAKAAARRRRT